MPEPALYSRLAEPLVVEALADSPVVLLHGARQCGKTTLARMLGTKRGYAYISFDDNISRTAAESDPVGFVDSLPSRVILDEVQRVPGLFTTLKAVIDRDRQPGRFLLTGSANVLLLPKLADSLAGRMAIQRLHPLAQCELAGKASHFLEKLFVGDFKHRNVPRLKDELIVRVTAGGYPAALVRPAGRRRANWYRDYIDALIQRDVRDMSRISALDVLPRLLAHAAAHTAQLFNLSELAAPFQLSRPTIGDYVTLLERIFLLERLPPWYSNRASRLVKTPKLHFGDTGLACGLLGVDTGALAADRALFGHLLETFVFQELRKQASWNVRDHAFFHFRDQNMQEVDIVIERGARELAGVEVKASATVTAADFSGLRRLRDVAGKRFVAGVVLYDGETCARFGEGMYAVPIRMLWELR
ncbi:MAG: ATP-binding protein [Xanthomonadales bacterium PRO7]|jgi:predicted AAA+ superfamily ATPase|nr:ATP-binding protein [Xanthomonadales bacterium PRO7]HMM56192.1 ATP-binding protein [Rudaea sp.]